MKLNGWFAAMAALLTACASQEPAPVTDRGIDVDEVVRAPAEQDGTGLQVYPLQNAGVQDLAAQARQAEQAGEYERAAAILERALRLKPKDPELLQHMAEVQLQQKHYEQALNFASRSYDVGPRVGALCSRNWRAIAAARAQLNDRTGAREAELRSQECAREKPESY